MEPINLINLLRGHKVYIQTHNFPDPDAIASAYGLQYLLKMHEVDSVICYDGKIDKLNTKRMIQIFNIDILSKDNIHNMQEYDYIITVDSQKYNANITDLIGDEVACIDHHPTFCECEYKYKDVRLVGACSSIIGQYLYKTNTPITEDIATALVYGIKMDTAEFTRGVTELDIDMFAYLLKLANKQKLTSLYTHIMEFQDLKAYGAAIENIEVFDNVGFAYIPFDCPDALVAMISDFILTLDVVDVAIIYSVRSDGYKFSVRSEIKEVHAGSLTKKALEGIGSGGGHQAMAGGFVGNESLVKMDKDINYKIRDRFLKIIL